jgi:transcriptional regulator with XRE-family HTH domain
MRGDSLPDVLQRIAANVRGGRRRLGLTQAQLAERAEVDLRHVQRVEGAEVNASVASLHALAGALSLEIAQLFRAAKMPATKVGRPRSVRGKVGRP